MYCRRCFYKQKLFDLLLLIFFTACLTENIYAQSAGDKLIPGDKLKWEYFTGKPDTASGYWATTLWDVYYKYNIVSFHLDTVKVELHLLHFLNPNSWVLSDKETDELLKHEQVHFNTALLCEAEFKKAIDTTVLLMKDYGKTIDAVFNSILNNIRELNVQYDKETNHMWNRGAQKAWEEKINDMINKANKQAW